MSQNRNDQTPGRSGVGNPPSPPDIIECAPVPRVQLVLGLRINPDSDPARVSLSTARLISAILTADRKLRLVVDPSRSAVTDRDVRLVFTPTPLGVETAERLGRLFAVVREAVTDFEGATLSRVEVLPQG